MAWFERPEPVPDTEGDVVGARIAAFLVDFVLISIVGGLAWGAVVEIAQPLAALLYVLIGLAYFVYLEGTYGQTIGKMALDIVVVTEDGAPIEYVRAAIRELVRVVDTIPYPLHGVGMLTIYLTDREQRLGDLAAETVVVRAEEPEE